MEDLVAIKNWRVLALETTHDFLSGPYRAIERLHLLVSFVSLPCDVLDMLRYWFLVSVELALVRPVVRM